MSDFAINNVLRLGSDSQVYYFATASNDVIGQYIKVLVIEPSNENYVEEDIVQGYQRPASSRRQREIGDYLRGNPDDVVPPAVLNGAGEWTFTPDISNPSIGTLTLKGKAHVIDGQHRLGGYIYLWNQTNFTIFRIWIFFN